MASTEQPPAAQSGGPRYAIVPIVRGAEGSGPDVPEGVGFLLLAGPITRGCSYALYSLDVPETLVVPQAQAVPDDIEALIWGGEAYPPALAQVRDAVALAHAREPQPSEFLRAYAERLAEYLAAQRESAAFLARCVHGQIGFLTPGAWYWLLTRTEDGSRVRWVSSDYHVYTDPSETFDVTPSLLLQLPSF